MLGEGVNRVRKKDLKWHTLLHLWASPPPLSLNFIFFFVFWLVGWLGFNVISTIVGYFMPNPFLYIKTVLFQTIQFSINIQFCELNYHDQKIGRTLTQDIRKYWTAVSTLIGLISSVYRDLHHWKSNQQPQITVSKIYFWATRPHPIQVTRIHWWWDLIRSKQLFSVPVCRA